MKVIVATHESHPRSTITPTFEGAPYYLAVDTQTARRTLFLHPVQFQAAFTPASLVRNLRGFAPDVIVAGSFSAEVHRVASSLQIELVVVHGRAADAIDQLHRQSRSNHRRYDDECDRVYDEVNSAAL